MSTHYPLDVKIDPDLCLWLVTVKANDGYFETTYQVISDAITMEYATAEAKKAIATRGVYEAGDLETVSAEPWQPTIYQTFVLEPTVEIAEDYPGEAREKYYGSFDQ
jgi:hypothetical protein